MTATLIGREWIREQFEGVDLGDARRDARLGDLAAGIIEKPGVSLPNAFMDWADLKAGYRFLSNKKVSFDKIMSPHWDKTLDACRAGGEYLVVEDTTGLSFGKARDIEGMSRAGKGEVKGMYVHSSLALRVERWDEAGSPEVTVAGLLGQKTWVRKGKTRRRSETRRQRLNRPRESDRWATVFQKTGCPPQGTSWTYMADRESDIFTVMARCREKGVGYIIRACQPRKIVEVGATIQHAVSSSPAMGEIEISLRARPGQKARRAKLEIRAVRVSVRPPRIGGRGFEAEWVNVVEVREVGAPVGVEPLLWVLLTSWDVGTFEDVCRVVKAYSKRWLIEEYHKALKTGTGIEHAQLSTRGRLENLLGILGVEAVWLLGQKLLCSSRPDELVVRGAVDEDVLRILEARFGRPKGGWTNRRLFVSIARLGGFLNRKGDGNPGWITIWRGWRDLTTICNALELLRRAERCG
jgi:hypothetical protein